MGSGSRILVIESSPHRDGSSNMLAKEFVRGAEEAGNTVTVFDVAHPSVGPCKGCDACGMDGRCVQRDGMDELRELLLSCDTVVFVTPLYYFGVSAQLKAAIDRFYAFNGRLTSKRLRAALIVAAWNADDWTMTDVSSHFRTLCRYLGMENRGEVLATGCGTPSMTARSPFMREAYELGRGMSS